MQHNTRSTAAFQIRNSLGHQLRGNAQSSKLLLDPEPEPRNAHRLDLEDPAISGPWIAMRRTPIDAIVVIKLTDGSASGQPSNNPASTPGGSVASLVQAATIEGTEEVGNGDHFGSDSHMLVEAANHLLCQRDQWFRG